MARNVKDDDFYAIGEGKVKNEERVWCRIPTEFARIGQIILASKKFPYKTVSDIWRDAIWHRLPYLSEQAGEDAGMDEMSHLLMRARNISDLLKDEEISARRLIDIDRLERMVKDYGRDSDGVKAAKATIKQYMDNVDAMPDSYWKRRYTNEVRARFSDLMPPWDMSKRSKE